MVACTGNPRSGESWKNRAVYQQVQKEESVLLFPEQKDRSPRLNLKFALLDLSGSKAEGQFLQNVLYGQNTPDEYKEKVIREYTDEYFQMREAVAQNPDFFGESLNWFYSEIMERTAIFSRGIGIRWSREYYTGGAHGMREAEYFILDLAAMKRLKLEDLIKPGSEPALMEEVVFALRDLSNLDGDAPLSSGNYFEDTVEVPQNFFINSRGLGFHWDPYEIAPYAVGPIEILIPYDKIKNLLTPQGLSIIDNIKDLE
jgi:hypothetical protein